MSKIQIDHCEAAEAGDFRHPASIMAGLGIEYEYSQGEPLGELYVFHGCVNVPRTLPAYVTARM